MGKDKLRKFRENLTFACFVQPDFDEVFRHDHPLKGHWGRDFFHNDHPIVLELGCGKGEYTVALAERDPSRNYIGVDIKGARMWRGAKTATERGMRNVGFLRTRIEFITSLFAEGEVAELWITFPDPQLKSRRAKKRLTSPLFLEYYAQLLQPDGWINLKTDSQHLYGYTNEVIRHESRHLRLGLRRRGALGQDRLRTAVPAHGAADHLHAFRARRAARLPVVRMGGGRETRKGQRRSTKEQALKPALSVFRHRGPESLPPRPASLLFTFYLSLLTFTFRPLPHLSPFTFHFSP